MSQTGAQLAQGAALNGAALPVMAEGVQSAGSAAGAVLQPKASAAQVGRAVFWSFIGIRKSSGHENDVAANVGPSTCHRRGHDTHAAFFKIK